MSKFYHVYVEADHKWIGAPNNGGECCVTPEDTVEELNKLLQERDSANARLEVQQRANENVDRIFCKALGIENPSEAFEVVTVLKDRVRQLEEAGDDLDMVMRAFGLPLGPVRIKWREIRGSKP